MRNGFSRESNDGSDRQARRKAAKNFAPGNP